MGLGAHYVSLVKFFKSIFIYIIFYYRVCTDERFESAPQGGVPFKSVTGNLVEEFTALRFEFLNGVKNGSQ